MTTCKVAHGVPNTYIVVAIDQAGWLRFDIRDFDDYRDMPAVMKFGNNFYSKRGWDSDKLVCFYCPGTTSIANAANLEES